MLDASNYADDPAMQIKIKEAPPVVETSPAGVVSKKPNGTDAIWDIQFDYDVETSSGFVSHAGAETDGTNFYTTKWNGAEIHKFDMSGNYVETFSITGVSGTRDLAYDGTYFYGGAASTTIWEMDFASQTLVSSISFSGDGCRAIAYDNDNDAFWLNNWDSDMLLIDRNGQQVDMISGIPSIYGCAFDNMTTDAPYLWMFAGTTTGGGCWIEQMDLASGTITGVTHSVSDDFGADRIAGGLFFADGVVTGKTTLGGLAQGTPNVLFGYEIGDSGPLPTNDVMVASILEPNTGPLTANEEVKINVKNNGTATQSNIPVYFIFDGNTYTGTVAGPLNTGETEEYTFSQTIDLSTPGQTYDIEACTDMSGDENTANDCKTKSVTNNFGIYCDASGGCDEFIDGVVFGDIDNQGTDCGNYQDFTNLSTVIEPGNTYQLTLYNGNMYTSDDWGVWIDWNADGTFNMTDELVVCDIDNGAASHTFDITVPAGATQGDTRMRIRLKWSGSDCGDPCGTTTYGEVEDYTVTIGQPADDDLGVTEIVAPVSGQGLTNDEDVTVTIKNFGAMAQSSFDVSYTVDGANMVIETVSATVDPGMTYDYTFTQGADLSGMGQTYTIESCTQLSGDANPANDCMSKDVEHMSGSFNLWDIVFDYDVETSSGFQSHAGAETDGSHFYTTKWNGAEIHKFDMSGNYVETFSIGGVSGLRDLAYDGTYFYGGAASTTIYEMDFDNQTQVSTISFSGDGCRSIGYDNTNDAFWLNNWDSPMLLIDRNGQQVDMISGPPSIYGNAYDEWTNVTDNGPYLWLFAGTTTGGGCWVEQMDISTGSVTGVTHSVSDDFGADRIAGGLFLSDEIMTDTYILGGLAQGTPNLLFGYYIGDGSTPPQLDAPENVMAMRVDDDVHITWDYEIPEPEWIHWDDGINADAIGLTGGGTFYVGARFTSAELGDYDGQYITKVSFFNNEPTATFVLKIWTGANAGTEVLSQPLSGLNAPDWNEIDLTTPVEIDATQELWIGYEVTHGDAVFPAGCDAGPAVANFGDMLSIDGTTWESMSIAYGLDYNWNIQGLVSPTADGELAKPIVNNTTFENNGTPVMGNLPPVENAKFVPNETKAFIEFNIYKDGSYLASTTDLEYWDMDVPNAIYEYCVSAVYDEGESDQVCDTVLVNVGIAELAENISVFPNPVEGYLNISTESDIEQIKLINAFGQMVSELKLNNTKAIRIDTEEFEAGIYILQIHTNGEVINKQIIIK